MDKADGLCTRQARDEHKEGQLNKSVFFLRVCHFASAGLWENYTASRLDSNGISDLYYTCNNVTTTMQNEPPPPLAGAAGLGAPVETAAGGAGGTGVIDDTKLPLRHLEPCPTSDFGTIVEFWACDLPVIVVCIVCEIALLGAVEEDNADF
jgi:hypothetical protein